MVNTCALCDSGHTGSTYNGGYFTFPSDVTHAELRRKWLIAVPKPGFLPKKSSRLCELHFDPGDLETERKDSKKRRSDERGEKKRKSLKPGAVPMIWPRYPEYYSKPLPIKRETAATAEERSRNETIRDRVTTIDDIRKKLSGKMPPNMREFVDANGKLVVYSLETDPIPKITFSVVVSDDLTFKVYCDGLPRLDDRFPSKINQFSDVLDILDISDSLKKDYSLKNRIELVQSILKSYYKK